jgi:quercetin dioxygenase-like cupin family protein
MIRNVITILAITSSVLLGCNSETKPADTETSDTATNASTPASTETPPQPAFDNARGVTVISPKLYQQLADTLNIRMIEGTYKPGDSSIMHAHPDFALYVLEGSMVELTGTDGSKQNVEFKKGMAVVMPAATHSAKNIGKSTLKLIVVEVNRPRM